MRVHSIKLSSEYVVVVPSYIITQIQKLLDESSLNGVELHYSAINNVVSLVIKDEEECNDNHIPSN